MSKFEKNWKAAQSSGSFGQKTRETIRGPQPLKPQIQKATGQLNQEVHRLDGALSRLKQRETAIFKKTVAAVQQHDEATSKAYSNELAEVKKMTKIVTQSKIALEQISMRLQTVTDVGDFAATLGPAIGVVRNVRKTLGTAMPDAQSALGDIGTELSSMMTDVGGLSGHQHLHRRRVERGGGQDHGGGCRNRREAHGRDLPGGPLGARRVHLQQRKLAPSICARDVALSPS